MCRTEEKNPSKKSANTTRGLATRIACPSAAWTIPTRPIPNLRHDPRRLTVEAPKEVVLRHHLDLLPLILKLECLTRFPGDH